jgi:hypothetical protein
MAAAFHKLSRERKLAAIQGFAAILATINIDDDLIAKPFPTEHRAALMNWSAPAVERWFAATDATWAIGDRRTAQELFQEFLSWAQDHDRRARDQVSNANIFGREMTKLESKYVTKGKSSGIAYTKFMYYDPETEEVVVAEKARAMQLNKTKGQMIEKGFLTSAKPDLADLFR